VLLAGSFVSLKGRSQEANTKKELTRSDIHKLLPAGICVEETAELVLKWNLWDSVDMSDSLSVLRSHV
jgi:hypothetical protein